MIECKECAAKISDAAKTCPSCGNPMAHGGATGKQKNQTTQSTLRGAFFMGE